MAKITTKDSRKMSNLLDRLERHLAAMDLYQKQRTGGELLIASRDEIRQLEKENAALKSTLIEIRDLCQRTGYSFEDQSFAATRLAQEALNA